MLTSVKPQTIIRIANNTLHGLAKIASLAGLLTWAGSASVYAETGWPLVAGAPGGGHFSEATQITPENVTELEVAWTHRSGDFHEGTNFIKGFDTDEPLQSSWQATPILIEDKLIVCTPYNRIIAVDAATGKERWSYKPDINFDGIPMPRCRGVTQWQDPNLAAGEACATRVIAPLADGRLIALDPHTGERCPFGKHAELNLREGLGDFRPGEYMLNTPPAILGNLVIAGGTVADNVNTDVPSGVVRAYDLQTGELAWKWLPVLQGDSEAAASAEETSSEAASSEYLRGTTNVWSFISVDAELDLIYVPTGNTSPDYYGGHRNGSDYYSSSVVALKAATGEVAWHFQTVHHDIWDFDVPAQPTLFDYQADGKTVRGLAQPTKQGYVFLLNRENGEPLFPVHETPVPQDAVAGDYTSPTQPVPERPRNLFEVPGVTEKVWGLTFLDKGMCEDTLSQLRYEGPFTPASEEGALHMPSAFGGQNWGGPAIDRDRNVLVVNTLHVGSVIQMIPREQCSSDKLPEPVAPGVFLDEPSEGTPYCNRRWLGFVSPFGAPCTPPPWGTLAGIDLVTGEVRWQVPLGTTRDKAPFPFWFIKGAPNMGGPVVTRSGLTFIGATTDHYVRAFNTDTGEEIWKARLPTSAHGLPMTYQLANGRQYVVVSAGGHSALGTPPGDHLIAYALPQN